VLCSALSVFVLYQRLLVEIFVCACVYLLVYLHDVEKTYIFEVTS